MLVRSVHCEVFGVRRAVCNVQCALHSPVKPFPTEPDHKRPCPQVSVFRMDEVFTVCRAAITTQSTEPCENLQFLWHIGYFSIHFLYVCFKPISLKYLCLSYASC